MPIKPSKAPETLLAQTHQLWADAFNNVFELWADAFNSAFDECNGPEADCDAQAAKVAWATVKRGCKKK